MSVEVRGQMSFLPIPHLLFCKTRFLTILRFINSAKWASQSDSRLYLACHTPLTPSQMSTSISASLFILGSKPTSSWYWVITSVLLFISLNQMTISSISLFPFLPGRKAKDAHNNLSLFVHPRASVAPASGTMRRLYLMAASVCQLVQGISPPRFCDPKIKDGCFHYICVFPVVSSSRWRGLWPFLFLILSFWHQASLLFQGKSTRW